MHLIQSLASKELVRNIPKLKFDQHFYDACKIGKQAHASHKAKNIVSTTRCLELLHMDLFGPSAVQSYRGNRYTLVIVDDYSRLIIIALPLLWTSKKGTVVAYKWIQPGALGSNSLISFVVRGCSYCGVATTGSRQY
ncbi:retrovirus-related pol polyprotein from transposon TNT 1-94 [Tanacetum coccineum]|uniref:Retrovirus-related pol polyprotein from transposon TNT 1-94 n=1 Tax=Tanacetum coccineum TaxID=301880 RepID=A0ABQ5BJM2_9ASTR